MLENSLVGSSFMDSWDSVGMQKIGLEEGLLSSQKLRHVFGCTSPS